MTQITTRPRIWIEDKEIPVHSLSITVDKDGPILPEVSIEAPFANESHEILMGIHGDIKPLRLDMVIDGINTALANMLCRGYVVDIANMRFTADFMQYPGSNNVAKVAKPRMTMDEQRRRHENSHCAYCRSPWYPDAFHPGCCAECGGPKRAAIECVEDYDDDYEDDYGQGEYPYVPGGEKLTNYGAEWVGEAYSQSLLDVMRHAVGQQSAMVLDKLIMEGHND